LKQAAFSAATNSPQCASIIRNLKMEARMTLKFTMAAGALAMLLSAVPTQVQAQSLSARCEDYAYRVAYRRGSGDAVGQGAVTGAFAGGVLGAILGRGKGRNIVGGAVAGTAAGALLGAAGSRGGYVNRRAYQRAYNDCIDRNRIMPVRRYNDDVEYCLSRFRSYNPETGMYRTYSGQYRSCP
jgi:uncharacterized protein YcfJ